MQVRTPALQHAVMIEAVENHMPEVIVIDEIGTELEAAAARTIAERGVQLVGTAHGNTLDNLMLNPTLSDLIGGIQSVTLGDEEARRRGTQKTVLERKAPPTFDVVVEIQDRDRVAVHPDVAETVDAMLRGDPIAPEIRWRDEAGVHKTQSRPRPGPSSQMPGERFGGQVATGPAGWRVEPGWRPGQRREEPFGYRDTGARGSERERELASGIPAGRQRRVALVRSRGANRSSGSERPPAASWGAGPEVVSSPGFEDPVTPVRSRAASTAAPFQSGEIADRGPVERGTLPTPEPRARDSREFDRQREWRESAMRAIRELRAEASAVEVESDEAAPAAGCRRGRGPGRRRVSRRRSVAAVGRLAGARRGDRRGRHPSVRWPRRGQGPARDVERARLRRQPQAARAGDPRAAAAGRDRARGGRRGRRDHAAQLLQAEGAGAARGRGPGTPIYVLKSNTIVQMEACLTALFSLDVDPNEAALREVEDAIGLVRQEQKPVELSPQNAYIRRLQHQAAERANYVSRSRGREPFRRVRVYPDRVRAWR